VRAAHGDRHPECSIEQSRMIAYLVLVHRYPEQFKRMFRSIYDPGNFYLVHVDKNSGPALDDDIRAFLADFPNSAVLDGRGALWGGYSLVDAELRGMARLLTMGLDWKFFINLSGQDFPLKTQAQIAAYLTLNAGKEFIRTLDQEKIRPDTMSRVQRYVVEHPDRISNTPIVVRPFLTGASPYIGTQWKVVSRRFCEFVCHDPQADRFKTFYRNTFIADESFFQTVMMNTLAHGDIVNDDLRTIDWVPDGDIKLRPRTFTIADRLKLTTGRNLFARKFDETVDSKILDWLEDQLREQASEHDAAPLAVVA
jgi:hypothetical protein